MNRFFTFCLLSAAIAAAGCTMSNKTASSSDSGTPAESQINGTPGATLPDQQFVMDASAGGAYEVQASRIALNKTSSDSVKRIANQMIADHTKANNTLGGIAKMHDVKAVTVPNESQMSMIKTLDGLQGADFDREYLRQQQQAHQDTIAKFENESQNGTGDFKTFAANTLPTLRNHLNMINNAMSGNGNMNNMNMGSSR